VDVFSTGRPFPQESVDGHRKEEFQWTSSVLVGDKSCIWPEKLRINYP